MGLCVGNQPPTIVYSSNFSRLKVKGMVELSSPLGFDKQQRQEIGTYRHSDGITLKIYYISRFGERILHLDIDRVPYTVR